MTAGVATVAVAAPSGTVHCFCGTTLPIVTVGTTMLSESNADFVLTQPVKVRVVVTV